MTGVEGRSDCKSDVVIVSLILVGEASDFKSVVLSGVVVSSKVAGSVVCSVVESENGATKPHEIDNQLEYVCVLKKAIKSTEIQN